MEAIYHIETDLECRVLHFGTELCTAVPGKDAVVALRKGRHRLSFVSTENPLDSYTTVFEVPENDIEDYFEANLKGIRQERLEKEGAVDLGLSVKWRSLNLGATRPEEFGDFYAWGETEPYYEDWDPEDFTSTHWKEGKKCYDWTSYKWSKGKAKKKKLTKYCSMDEYWAGSGSPDCKAVLDPEDDAAHVRLGGSWRMPTMEECEELSFECTWSYTVLNGVMGHKVTGPNGNSIFLPAAGWWDQDKHRNDDDYFYGNYWSSSLRKDMPAQALEWGFCSEYDDIGPIERFIGLPIRPVTE